MLETNFPAEVGFAPDVARLARPEKPAKPPILCIFRALIVKKSDFPFCLAPTAISSPVFQKRNKILLDNCLPAGLASPGIWIRLFPAIPDFPRAESHKRFSQANCKRCKARIQGGSGDAISSYAFLLYRSAHVGRQPARTGRCYRHDPRDGDG